MRLKGKIGIVTAAASGMGRAGALRFAEEGAKVGVVDVDAAGVELVHRDCDAPLSAHVLCAKGHEVPLDQAAVRLKDEEHGTSMRARSRRTTSGAADGLAGRG